MKILMVSTKENYAAKKLAKEAKKLKIALNTVSARQTAKINPKNYGVLYVRNPYAKGSPKYLPQVITLAKKFKKAGKKVVDSVIADGKIAQGKWVDYQKLIKAGLPIPKTQILSRRAIPKTFPFILKWVYGFKGKNVFLINNQKEFNRVFAKYPKGELLVQEFVQAQYEYKIITVGYKALPVILRFAIHPVTKRPDFNTARSIPIYGRPGLPMNLPTGQAGRRTTKLITLAEKASKTLKRELSKVDILESRGKLYILEVNRFPGLDSFEKLAKYNVAKSFLEYLSRTN